MADENSSAQSKVTPIGWQPRRDPGKSSRKTVGPTMLCVREPHVDRSAVRKVMVAMRWGTDGSSLSAVEYNRPTRSSRSSDGL